MKWQTGCDSYHRIGDTWVLSSAVQAVEKSAMSDGWSRIHLASGAEVKVKGTPEDVIRTITRKDQPND